MKFSTEKAIEILERTPSVLSTLLSGLPDHWTRVNEGGDTWSAFDVVGHLLHGEKTDWMPRLQIVMSDKEPRRFTPFDRFAQLETSKGKTLEELLVAFDYARKSNLEVLKNLNLVESDLHRTAEHPALGEVTLENLLATWVVHDLGHIAQISRVMAKQWKAETGPWVEYLRVIRE